MNFSTTLKLSLFSAPANLLNSKTTPPPPAPNTAYSLFSYPLLRMVASPKIGSIDSSARSHVLVIEFQNQICKSSSKRKDELNGQK